MEIDEEGADDAVGADKELRRDEHVKHVLKEGQRYLDHYDIKRLIVIVILKVISFFVIAIYTLATCMSKKSRPIYIVTFYISVVSYYIKWVKITFSLFLSLSHVITICTCNV